jgi:hypothetical protein
LNVPYDFLLILVGVFSLNHPPGLRLLERRESEHVLHHFLWAREVSCDTLLVNLRSLWSERSIVVRPVGPLPSVSRASRGYQRPSLCRTPCSLWLVTWIAKWRRSVRGACVLCGWSSFLLPPITEFCNCLDFSLLLLALPMTFTALPFSQYVREMQLSLLPSVQKISIRLPTSSLSPLRARPLSSFLLFLPFLSRTLRTQAVIA